MVTRPTEAVISAMSFGSRQSPFSSKIDSQSSVSGSTGVGFGGVVGEAAAVGSLMVASATGQTDLRVGLTGSGSVISRTLEAKVCLIRRRLLRLIS